MSVFPAIGSTFVAYLKMSIDVIPGIELLNVNRFQLQHTLLPLIINQAIPVLCVDFHFHMTHIPFTDNGL